MLGEHPAQHGETSLKYGANGAEVLALLRSNEGKVVGGVLRIGSNSFGNADAQLCSFSLSDRASFTSIEPKWVDQSLDDFLFRLKGPGHASKLGGNGIGLLYPLGQRAPAKLALSREMPTQVPGVADNADACVKRNPVVHLQPEPGVSRGTECKTLLWSRLGSKIPQVEESGIVSILEGLLMGVASRRDGPVVGESSRFDPMRFHQLNPGMKEVGYDGHAEWAPLWNAALLEVRRAQAITNGVMVSDVLMEIPVRSEHPLWETASFEEEVDQRSLDSVKALPDVCAPSCDLFSPQLGKLEVDRSEVPGVFSPSGSSSTSIELWVLP